MKLSNVPRAELYRVAEAMLRDEVFTSFQVRDLERDLPSVFMVLVLMDKKDIPDDAGMVFEYMSKAMPMAVNGYPTFASAHFLNGHDTKIVMEKYQELLQAVEQVLKPEKGKGNGRNGLGEGYLVRVGRHLRVWWSAARRSVVLHRPKAR